MKHYIIYKTATLEVKWLESRQDDTDPVPEAGYSFLLIGSDLNGRSIDNFWVDSAHTLRTRSSKPSRFHIWQDEQWVEDAATRLAADSDTVRTKRNQLLTDSDWTDTLSAKTRLGDAKYAEWQVYRQALRDITIQPGFPTNVVWPTPPA